MLKAHADCNSFGFYLHSMTVQPAINIACRVPCSQYDRTFEYFSGIRFDTDNAFLFYYQ